MPKTTSLQSERQVITGQINKRPYGTRVRIHVQSSGALGGAEEVCVPLGTGAFLTVSPALGGSRKGSVEYVVTLEGFATAGTAEIAGNRLAQALLWMAVSTDVPLRLDYSNYRPASVFERGKSSESKCISTGEGFFPPGIVLGELQVAYEQLHDPNEKLLLSMEIFCGARLEASQRATFLAIVSALEPLVCEAELGSAVSTFVDQCIEQLQSSTTIMGNLKPSLKGRLDQLRKESIRQALLRLIHEKLPHDSGARDKIDHAYGLRSALVHNGTPSDQDVDIEAESQTVSRIIRDLYASILNRTLVKAD